MQNPIFLDFNTHSRLGIIFWANQLLQLFFQNNFIKNRQRSVQMGKNLLNNNHIISCFGKTNLIFQQVPIPDLILLDKTVSRDTLPFDSTTSVTVNCFSNASQ